MIKFLAALPSTNARVFVTLLVFIATAGRYLLSDVSAVGFAFEPWDPSWDWLLFIAAMSGLDLATFAAKRKTDADYIAAMNAAKLTTDRSRERHRNRPERGRDRTRSANPFNPRIDHAKH